MSACRGCGTSSAHGDATPEHCPACPPTTCAECGGVNVWGTDDLCTCWVSIEEMPLADVKALFADDCDGPGLSVAVNL